MQLVLSVRASTVSLSVPLLSLLVVIRTRSSTPIVLVCLLEHHLVHSLFYDHLLFEFLGEQGLLLHLVVNFEWIQALIGDL